MKWPPASLPSSRFFPKALTNEPEVAGKIVHALLMHLRKK
jgi:hypothetical protein